MVFQILLFMKQIFLLPPRLSLRKSGFYASQIICQMQSQFSIFFCFHVRVLNVWSWSWTCECQTWVSVFFFCPLTYSQAMNRALVGMWRSTTRVRVTLFHLEEVIYLCLMLIISLILTNLFYITKPFSVCLYYLFSFAFVIAFRYFSGCTCNVVSIHIFTYRANYKKHQ